MQWFLKEQTEEVATMSDLLAVATRNAELPENIEEYLAREHGGGEAEDPTAPPWPAATSSGDHRRGTGFSSC